MPDLDANYLGLIATKAKEKRHLTDYSISSAAGRSVLEHANEIDWQVRCCEESESVIETVTKFENVIEAMNNITAMDVRTHPSRTFRT